MPVALAVFMVAVGCAGPSATRAPIAAAPVVSSGVGVVLPALPETSATWWKRGAGACPAGARYVANFDSDVDARAARVAASSGRVARCVDVDAARGKVGAGHGPFASWRPDGSLESVGWLEHGAMHGRFLYFDSAGLLRASGYYRRGKVDGLWERFDASGISLVRERYEFGFLSGRRTVRQEDGSVRVETYARGKLNGPVEVHHANGRLALRGSYHRGSPDGVWSQYAADGRQLGSFELRRGTGPFRVWHDNGVLAVDGRYQRGMREGGWTFMAASGKRIERVSVHHGNGPIREYYGTGNIRLSGLMAAGERDGVWTWWRADGRVDREVAYDHGSVITSSYGKAIGGH